MYFQTNNPSFIISQQHYISFQNLLLRSTTLRIFGHQNDDWQEMKAHFTKLIINLRLAVHAFWLVSIPRNVRHARSPSRTNLRCARLWVRERRTDSPANDSAIRSSIERSFRSSPRFESWKVSRCWTGLTIRRMLVSAVWKADPRRMHCILFSCLFLHQSSM